MNAFRILPLTLICLLLGACDRGEPPAEAETVAQEEPKAELVEPTGDQCQTQAVAQPVAAEITAGLTSKTLTQGCGATAAPGHTVVVHYTGWLYDEAAENNRGAKFDSSRDRDQRFSFPLGAGRVIKGWDQGVAGMAIGEVRELIIAPEMAYGNRGAGGAIPPGATLVFEVELFDLVGKPQG